MCYGVAYCEACGTKLPKQSAGRPRKFCPGGECAKLADAMERLETALKPVVDRLAAGKHRDKMNLLDLRFRLFTLLSDEIPRPRYPKGTVVIDWTNFEDVGGRFLPRR